MQIPTQDVVPQAPPSASPTPPASLPAPTSSMPTTAPATKLPVTGPSDVAQGALAIGLPVLLLGVVFIVLARRWRARTEG